jgi:hypothetical protein
MGEAMIADVLLLENVVGINVVAKSTEYECVFWINLALGRNNWRFLVNTVTNL